MDMEKIIKDFQAWCDDQDEQCPVVCLCALALLKKFACSAGERKDCDAI